jgi:cation diffusion facilitator family transporter
MARTPHVDHHGDHPALRGTNSVIRGGVLNIFLVIAKLSAGILGHSYALIADAIESATDILSSFILFLGLRLAAKAPDEEHPYGHGKAEPLAAAIVGLSMVGAAVFIVIESITAIVTPHPIPEPYTLYVLGVIILLKEGMFRYQRQVGREIKSNAVQADALHHRSDAISSLAAFIGIVVAIITGLEAADDYAALVAAVVILINAAKIMMPALAEMMDTAPPASIEERLRKAAMKVPGVHALEKCYVRKMGFEYYVDLHVEVDGRLSVFEGHDISHRVKDAIMEDNHSINDVLIHIEPFPNVHKQEG